MSKLSFKQTGRRAGLLAVRAAAPGDKVRPKNRQLGSLAFVELVGPYMSSRSCQAVYVLRSREGLSSVVDIVKSCRSGQALWICHALQVIQAL